MEESESDTCIQIDRVSGTEESESDTDIQTEWGTWKRVSQIQTYKQSGGHGRE